MTHLLIFGPGYTATRLAERLREKGWRTSLIGRSASAYGPAFNDGAGVCAAIAAATHILSSIPPEGDEDPVLAAYGADLARAPAQWTGYLSSTGVYGDCDGAFVDESAVIGGGRRIARASADLAWQALRGDVRIFRLPGIYGPGRSAFDRLADGRARRIDMAEQVFSRVHVDDIVSGVMASIDRGPAGVYNLADDLPCSQNQVIEEACRLTNRPLVPLLTLEQAGLSPQAAAFYAENRRVANGKAKRLLGWRPQYRDYRRGLCAILAEQAAPVNGIKAG